MLIDEFLPEYHYSSDHSIIIRAGREQVLEVCRRLDITNARLTSVLFRLRGIRGSNRRFDRSDLLRMGFVELGESDGEFAMGLIGRFWTVKGDIQRFERDEFRGFVAPGYAKTVWNFRLGAGSENEIVLSTQTRIFCTDEHSRRRFLVYWSFVGPFSGIVRRDILRELKRQAESG